MVEWHLWGVKTNAAHLCGPDADGDEPEAPEAAPATPAPIAAPVPQPVAAPLVTVPAIDTTPASTGKSEAAAAQVHQMNEAVALSPGIDPAYRIDIAQHATLKRLIARADSGEIVNVGLFGDAGSGKTSLGLQIGAIRNAPTFVQEVASIGSADEALAITTGIDKTTGKVIAIESHFVRGIETPNAVVILNDLALLQSRTVQNGFSELLDPTTRATYSAALGRMIRVAPGVMIIGTWNVGSQFTGASELSEQLLDRFRAGAIMEVPYPPRAELERIIRSRTNASPADAKRLSQATEWLRGDSRPFTVSTRSLLSAAQLCAAGATVGQALAHTVLGDLPLDEMTRAYAVITVKSKAESDEDIEIWAAPELGNYADLSALAAQEN